MAPPRFEQKTRLAGRVWRRLRASDVAGQAAKMSFYLLLALFPLLLSLVSMVGLLLQSETLPQDVLGRYLSGVLPASASALVDRTLVEISGRSASVTLPFALVFLWWSALKAMRAVMDGLNAAHRVRESRPWWKQVGVASALTVALLLLLSLGLAVLVLGRRWQDSLAGNDELAWLAGLWPVARWLVALAIVLLAFNLAYRYAPDVDSRRWQWLTPGTLLGLGLWLVASLGFQLYVQHFRRYSATYGSIGAVITLLLWLYLSAIAFLSGAEINAEVAESERAGSGAP